MGNTVQVVFEPKDLGLLSMIDKIDRAHASVARSATSAGRQMDGALGPTHKAWQQVITDIDTAGMSTRQAKQALKEYADQALDTQERIERVAASARRAASEMERLERAGFGGGKGQARLPELDRLQQAGFGSNFDVKKFTMRDRGNARGPSDGAVLARFEDAARNVSKLKSGIDEADKSTAKLTVRAKDLVSVLLNLADVPLREAFGRGLGLAGIEGAKAVGIAALTAVGNIAIEKTEEVRRKAEENLRLVEKNANLGLIGGRDKIASDLERLGELRSEALERSRQGLDPNKFLTKELGVETTLTDIVHRIETGKKELERLTARFGNTQDQFDRARAERRAQEAVAELARQTFQPYLQDSQERLKREDEIIRSAKSSIRELELQAQESDPYKLLFHRGEQQALAFKDRLRDISGDITTDLVSKFEKASKGILSLELFKADLSGADRLNTLFFEQERLRAGLGGESLRQERADFDKLRREISKEIFDKRNAGTLTTKEHFELLDRFAKAEPGKLQKLQDEFTAKQLSSAQQLLERADNDAKRALALDRILQVTSDIGRLTPEQTEARLKALEQRASIESNVQAEKQAREDRLAQSQDNFVKAVDKLDGAISKFSESVGKAGSGLSGDKPPATVIVKVEGETSGVSVSKERLGLTPDPLQRGNGLYVVDY